MSERFNWACITIILCTFFIMSFGSIWVAELSTAKWDINFNANEQFAQVLGNMSSIVEKNSNSFTNTTFYTFDTISPNESTSHSVGMLRENYTLFIHIAYDQLRSLFYNTPKTNEKYFITINGMSQIAGNSETCKNPTNCLIQYDGKNTTKISVSSVSYPRTINIIAMWGEDYEIRQKIREYTKNKKESPATIT